MPSPRPSEPIVSLVVALIPTEPGSTPSTRAMRSRIFWRWGFSLGASAITETSQLMTRKPSSRAMVAMRTNRSTLETSFHRGSPGGKMPRRRNSSATDG